MRLQRCLIPCLLLASASTLAAQTARTVEETPFLAAPGGAVQATLLPETPLTLGEARNSWRRATLEGWVWLPSLRKVGPDVVVARPGGENLRDAPNGQRIAALQPGLRLLELERRDNWVRVRRSGWVRAAALRSPDARPDSTHRPAPAVAAATAAPATAAAADVPPLPATRSGPAGAPLLASPDGDTLARISPLAAVHVLESRDGWSRVRIDGWVPTRLLTTAADSAILDDVTAATFSASPELLRGRLVRLSLQFISLRNAEPIRTDFAPGEPFLLTRGPDLDNGFVYVAVPPALLDAARRLAPLQHIHVLARIRNPRSALMHAPVVDLVEFLTPPQP